VSLQYVSPVSLDVSAGGRSATLRPSQEGPGVYWRALAVTSGGGAERIAIRAHGLSPLATFRNVLLGSVVLTRNEPRERTVPLHDACGRYIDWYAPSAA
jgi:hypothetical protein